MFLIQPAHYKQAEEVTITQEITKDPGTQVNFDKIKEAIKNL